MVEKNDYLNKTQFSVNPKWTGNLKELANAVQAGGGGAGEDSMGTMSSRNAALAQNPWAAAATYGTSQLADSSKSEVDQLKDLVTKEEQRDYDNFQWQRQNEEDASRTATDYQFRGDEAQRGRDFSAEQAALNRAFSSDEAQKGRDFSTSERLGSQDFASNETQKARDDWYKQQNKLHDLSVQDPNSIAMREFYNMLTKQGSQAGGSKDSSKTQFNSTSMFNDTKGNLKNISSAYKQKYDEITNRLNILKKQKQFSQFSNPEDQARFDAEENDLTNQLTSLEQDFTNLKNTDRYNQMQQRVSDIQSSRPPDISSSQVSGFAGLFSPQYSRGGTYNPNIDKQQADYAKKYGYAGRTNSQQARSNVLNSVVYDYEDAITKFGRMIGLTDRKSNQDIAADRIRQDPVYQWAANYSNVNLPGKLTSREINIMDTKLNELKSLADGKLGNSSRLLINDPVGSSQLLNESLPEVMDIAKRNGFAFNPGRDAIYENDEGSIMIINPQGKSIAIGKDEYGQLQQF